MSMWRDCSTHTCAYSIQRNPLWKMVGIVVGSLILLSIVTGVIVHFAVKNNDTPLQKAEKFLASTILFDGHNDFAYNLRDIVSNDLTKFNFSLNLSEVHEWSRQGFSQTDLVRLKAGGINAQFWVAKADCNSQFRDSVEITLEQIDVIKRLIEMYGGDMQFASSAQEVREAYDANKIASLIGINGGHSIQWSLGILRMYYELGVRYMSITKSGCSNPWADAANAHDVHANVHDGRYHRPLNGGLSPFGEKVVTEMNRIGMIIDLSHASVDTMKAVLIASKAPVIFSNSNAKSLCKDHHNIPDEILKLVKQTNGVVLVNFYPGMLACSTNASVNDVVEHLNYLREKMTSNNLGIGANFDGMDTLPEDLEDTSKYPNLFAALFETESWSESELERLAGKNLLRLMEDVENIRETLQEEVPGQSLMHKSELKKMNYTLVCTTSSKMYDTQPGPYDQGRMGSTQFLP